MGRGSGGGSFFKKLTKQYPKSYAIIKKSLSNKTMAEMSALASKYNSGKVRGLDSVLAKSHAIRIIKGGK